MYQDFENRVKWDIKIKPFFTVNLYVFAAFILFNVTKLSDPLRTYLSTHLGINILYIGFALGSLAFLGYGIYHEQKTDSKKDELLNKIKSETEAKRGELLSFSNVTGEIVFTDGKDEIKMNLSKKPTVIFDTDKTFVTFKKIEGFDYCKWMNGYYEIEIHAPLSK